MATETKRIEPLMILEALVLAAGVAGICVFDSQFIQMQFLGWSIIVASWIEFVNAILCHRWPKATVLITAQFVMGSALVIVSMITNAASSGVVTTVAILYGISLLMRFNLWESHASWLVNLPGGFILIIAGIVYAAGGIDPTICLALFGGLIALCDFILAFMKAKD